MKTITMIFALTFFASVQSQAVTKPTEIMHPVSITFDGAHLWVVSQLNGPQNTGSVFEITQRGTQVNSIALTAPSYLTGSDYDGEHIWVAGAYNSGAGTLTEIGSNGDILNAVTVGDGPFGVKYDGSGSIWVANELSRNVMKVDTRTGTILATISVGDHAPYLMALDGAGNLWVSCLPRTVYVINVASEKVVATYTYSINRLQTDTGIAFDGTDIWIADSYDNLVFRVDPATGAKLQTLTVGKSPSYIAFDGASLWVSNRKSNDVTQVDPKAGTVLGVIGVGAEPVAIAVANGYAWIANNAVGGVTRTRAAQPSRSCFGCLPQKQVQL
jgi:YVTN family beta-propeller protein